ncbi:T9SS type A sorting domain-containing protein [Pontimicrobium sp. MEBiC01747]
MKKTILKTLFAVLFFVSYQNAGAQKVKSNIVMSTTLDLDLNSSNTSITTYPNSTTYPGYYELEMRVTAFVHTFQPGTYTLATERRQLNHDTNVPISSWSSMVPNLNQFPNTGWGTTPSATYSGTARTTQLEGTTFQYRVKVTLNPTAAGLPNKTVYTPIRTAKVLGDPTPCFTMYNVNSTQNENSKYGPQPVNTICQYSVAINGSCSKFEEGYHVRVAEFDLASWSFVQDYYSGWVGSGEAPTYTSLNGLVASNGYSFIPGKLYVVGFSIGPVWESAPVQFFRVVACKESGEDTIEEVKDVTPVEIEVIDEEVANPVRLKLYPNPTENYFKISVNDSELEKGSSVSVMNSKGVEVYKGTVDTNNFEVNTSEWKTGVYFCKIQIGDRIETKKIIKK